MRERRRHLRFHADWAAAFLAQGRMTLAGQAQVRDVSREGIGLATPQQLVAGDRVELTVEVPGDHIPILASGEVAWVAAETAAFGAGVRFSRVDPLDLARMLGRLQAQWLTREEASPRASAQWLGGLS